jgi:hypothetical protein
MQVAAGIGGHLMSSSRCNRWEQRSLRERRRFSLKVRNLSAIPGRPSLGDRFHFVRRNTTPQSGGCIAKRMDCLSEDNLLATGNVASK